MIAKAYEKVDRDGSGAVDVAELRTFLQELNSGEDVPATYRQYLAPLETACTTLNTIE